MGDLKRFHVPRQDTFFQVPMVMVNDLQWLSSSTCGSSGCLRRLSEVLRHRFEAFENFQKSTVIRDVVWSFCLLQMQWICDLTTPNDSKRPSAARKTPLKWIKRCNFEQNQKHAWKSSKCLFLSGSATSSTLTPYYSLSLYKIKLYELLRLSPHFMGRSRGSISTRDAFSGRLWVI